MFSWLKTPRRRRTISNSSTRKASPKKDSKEFKKEESKVSYLDLKPGKKYFVDFYLTSPDFNSKELGTFQYLANTYKLPLGVEPTSNDDPEDYRHYTRFPRTNIDDPHFAVFKSMKLISGNHVMGDGRIDDRFYRNLSHYSFKDYKKITEELIKTKIIRKLPLPPDVTNHISKFL